MQSAIKLKSMLLWDLLPQFSKAINDCTDQDSIQVQSKLYLDQINDLVFPSVNQTTLQKKPEESKQVNTDLVQMITAQVNRFQDQQQKSIESLDKKIESIKTSQLLMQEVEKTQDQTIRDAMKAQTQSYFNLLTQQLQVLLAQKLRIEKINAEIGKKIETVVDASISELENSDTVKQTTTKTLQDDVVPTPQSEIQSDKLVYYLSDDYLPSQKQIQNYKTPSQFSYESSIIGIGDGFDRYECYFIFSDKSKTEHSQERSFREIMVQPEGTEIKRVVIQYQQKNGHALDGVVTGIAFYNVENKLVLQAGNITTTSQSWKIHEITLNKNERLLGIQSGLRDKNYARHYDLQFVIGSLQ